MENRPSNNPLQAATSDHLRPIATLLTFPSILYPVNTETNKKTPDTYEFSLSDKPTNKHTNTQTEKFKDLSPTQLTVSDSSQSSVDSVSLFPQ